MLLIRQSAQCSLSFHLLVRAQFPSFHISKPPYRIFYFEADIKMRSCLTPYRDSQCAPNRILKSGEKSKRHGRDMAKRVKQFAVFEREMKVKNQESGDKSRRELKGGSVGVNGPCP